MCSRLSARQHHFLPPPGRSYPWGSGPANDTRILSYNNFKRMSTKKICSTFLPVLVRINVNSEKRNKNIHILPSWSKSTGEQHRQDHLGVLSFILYNYIMKVATGVLGLSLAVFSSLSCDLHSQEEVLNITLSSPTAVPEVRVRTTRLPGSSLPIPHPEQAQLQWNKNGRWGYKPRASC